MNVCLFIRLYVITHCSHSIAKCLSDGPSYKNVKFIILQSSDRSQNSSPKIFHRHISKIISKDKNFRPFRFLDQTNYLIINDFQLNKLKNFRNYGRPFLFKILYTHSSKLEVKRTKKK